MESKYPDETLRLHRMMWIRTFCACSKVLFRLARPILCNMITTKAEISLCNHSLIRIFGVCQYYTLHNLWFFQREKKIILQECSCWSDLSFTVRICHRVVFTCRPSSLKWEVFLARLASFGQAGLIRDSAVNLQKFWHWLNDQNALNPSPAEHDMPS